MIRRTLFNQVLAKIDFHKALIISGPRQSGKTTLLNEIVRHLNKPTLFINGDNLTHRQLWATPDWNTIENLIAPYDIIFIDEAQRIENIGLTIKQIVDSKLKKQILVSGSSSINLADKLNEPLTGRKWEYKMFPIAWGELVDTYTLAHAIESLETRLIFGSYPEVVGTKGNEKDLLINLSNSYLFKDILELVNLKRPELIIRLLQTLAWQVGSEVSFNELAQTVQANKETVMRYLYFLEASFVIYPLQPLSRNPRNEISSTRKFYFYDNGIRNSLINNFSPISQRNDIGALWENYFITERKKYLEYNGKYHQCFFWRSKTGSEIDYVEEFENKFTSYVLKWNERAKVKTAKSFIENYHPIQTNGINKQNFWQHL